MSKTENDSDTKLFRFNKKMFLKLVPDEEQDKSYAYGKVVTQIYIEEKDGAELKKLKDEKQVSDLKQELSIDDSQNREAIEKRERQRKRDEKSKEITINENDVVRNLNNYSTILKDIDLSKLINYMMYLDEGIKIYDDDVDDDVDDDSEGIKINDDHKIIINVKKLKNKEKYLKKINDASLNGDKKNYLIKILEKIKTSKANNLINKRSNFINDKLSKITEWEDDNNIIKNTFIENYISANARLIAANGAKIATEAKAAEAAEAAAAAAAATAASASGSGAAAAAEAAAEAQNIMNEAQNKLKEYLTKIKNSNLFKEKIKNVKQYLRDEDNLEDSELINAAELDNTGYEAIQSINTLNENVEEFNKIFGIDN